MENDYYDVPEVFDELEPAYECFKTLINAGIPSGKIQIENCKKQLIEPDLIDIQCDVKQHIVILFAFEYIMVGICLWNMCLDYMLMKLTLQSKSIKIFVNDMIFKF